MSLVGLVRERFGRDPVRGVDLSVRRAVVGAAPSRQLLSSRRRVAAMLMLAAGLSAPGTVLAQPWRAERLETSGAIGRAIGRRTVLSGRLEWEKKDDSGGLHDVDNLYVWGGVCSNDRFCSPTDPIGCVTKPVCQPNEAAAIACVAGGGAGCKLCESNERCILAEDAITTVWDWLAQINEEGRGGFAGKSDWRLPEVATLQGIGDPGAPELESLRLPECDVFPCIEGAFDRRCTRGCELPECSCTGAEPYLSANVHGGFGVPVALFVQGLSFNPDESSEDGFRSQLPREPSHVRAVRDVRPPSAVGHGARVPVRRGRATDTVPAWVLGSEGVVQGVVRELLLFRSDDGGRTWGMPRAFPGRSGQLTFVDRRDGWLVTSEGLWRTVDGGDRWLDVSGSLPLPDDPEVGPEISLRRIVFADPMHGVVFGRYGGPSFDGRSLLAFTRDGGDTWSRAGFLSPSALHFGVGCITRGGAGMVSTSSPGDHTVLDFSQFAFRTVDFGASWEYLQGSGLRGDFTCADESTVWNAGFLPGTTSAGFLAHSADGGRVWEARVLPDGVQSVSVVTALGPQRAWVVSVRDAGLYGTDDAGLTWREVSLPLGPDDRLWLARFADEQRGLAVVGRFDEAAETRLGQPLFTEDGGETWQPSTLPIEIRLVVDLLLLP